LTGNGLVQFCTPVVGDLLAGATIVAGVSATDASNTACMPAFTYRMDEGNPSISTWHATNNAQRSCYFCDGDALGQYKVTGFTLPATTDARITGLDAVASYGTSSKIYSQINTASTTATSDYQGVDLAAACSASFLRGAATTVEYHGQGVTFNMPSVVNLAGGQVLVWEKGDVDFKGAITTTAGSNILTCGGRSWDVSSATTISASKVVVTLPASTAADLAGVTSAANTVVCPVGDVSVFIKGWEDTQTIGSNSLVAKSADCKCYAGRTTATDGTNAGTVNKYVSLAKWDWPAPLDPSAGKLYLSITDIGFTPNTIGSQTRFLFKPVNSWHASYAGNTVWTYNFGSNLSFADDSVCQALSSTSTGAFSAQVSKCELASNTATITMGVDGTPNFWIQVLSSYTVGTFVAGTDVVTGSLANYGSTLVQNQALAADNPNAMPTGANTPAANTTVTLAKSMNNIMDVGSVTLTWTL
jgi:hypothetical protein